MRNKLLDQVRFFAAFMVVLIHTPLPGVTGQALEAVFRVAVPMFFMVSGYYAFGKTKEKLLKSARKTAILLLWSVGLYLVWGALWSLYKGNTAEYLKNYFSLNSLVETVVFNNGILLGHLWFLLALLYCYLIYAFLLRKAPAFVKSSVSAVLLAGFFVIRELLKWNGVEDPIYYIRNFLFVGIPFFLLGGIVREFREKLLRIPSYIWFLFLALGIIGSITERFTVGCYDLYVGTPFAAVAIFSLVQNEKLPSNNTLAILGQKYAGDIYVFHSLVITIINAAASVVGLLNFPLFPWVRPLVVLAITLGVAFVRISIKNKFLNKV